MQTTIEKPNTNSESLLTDKIYWLNQLTGELPETNIINDFLRPEIYQGKNKTIAFKLSARLSQAIIRIARNSNFSIYLLLLSAFNILLHKYTGNQDAIVGIPSYQPIARNNRIIDRVLPLRLNINNEITFKEFLLQVKETVISAYIHQNYSIDELFDLLKIPQFQNRCSIYDVVIILENIHNKNCLVNLKNDLTVSFLVNDSVIEGKIEYDRSLFKNEAIATIINQFLTVVESVVEDFSVRVSNIVICQENERRLVKEFNDNAKSYPTNKTIQDLFVEQVAKTPNEIAVICNQDKLTYQELNIKANKLAALLRKLGVKKGDFIGIFQARNCNFLISIIAILKAGGAYVPLDCTYPPERIKYMLTNSEVKILLTQSSLLSMFAGNLEDYQYLQHIICLDTNDFSKTRIANINLYSQIEIEQNESENLEQLDRGSDRAYMIYTSGSTGLPKGAIVRHDGAINHIYAQFDALELHKGFTFLQSAPASSDISVWQFLAPILSGGRTVIADKETICHPEQLFNLIKQEKLNLVELVPVVLGGLLDYISQLSIQERLLPDLQCIMITGEYVAVELVNWWLSLYPTIKVANAYGPTEAADDITQFIATKPLPTNQRTVPIGKPLANLNLYILGSQMRLQPIGVPGEICVSGIGVGDGYWKNEEKTNSSFVRNPFISYQQILSGNNHDVIYKTGDLGRWLPDGNIEFLGRIDHQVKLRGFRIELGEIEALLTQHSAVRSPVVVVREDIPGDKRLIAYIVPNIDQSQQNNIASVPTTLRNFLKEKLPEHSIPSVVLLEALPLTPSGKVDRQALPAPDSSHRNREQNYIAPRTPVEEVIAGVWTQVLKSDRISIDDNFFEQGGHSLLATQLISRLRNIFQIELPLRYVFEFPTVEKLAQAVEMKRKQQGLQIPPIVPVPRNSNLPLSFAQEGLWFIHQLNPDQPIYNSPAAVRLTGSLNIPAFQQSLNEILQRHEALRTRFILAAGKPVQAIASNLTLQIPLVNLEDLPASEREREVLRLANREAKSPFDLAQPPLLRVTLLKLSQTDHVALFVMHHIATDGWSIGILIQELSTLYEVFCSEPATPTPLPELSIQYADFAYWQRQYLQGEILADRLNYWKQQLAGIPTTLNLEKLAGNPAATTRKGECAAQSFLLPLDLSEKIRVLSSQEGVTLFMTLLASFQILLYRYTDREDIVIGTDIANRDRPEIESIMGFFVNLLVLRGDLSGNPTFRELLERVREVTLEAYDHSDLPFARLVEALRPDRTTSITPLFQVLFVLQSVPLPAFKLSDLTVEVMELSTGLARFDLALFMEETERGIVGTWKYCTDLFNPDAIARISANLQTLLCSITQNPDTQIDTLEMLSESEKQAQITAKNQRDRSKFQKFKNIKPKSVNLAQQEVIQTSYLHSEQHLPLVIQPNENDINLADWASDQREFLETNLLQHGAILFRDFRIDSVLEFEKVANAICPDLFANYGDLPKAGNSEKVYSSTPYPSDRAILFHNESSHLHQYPLKIWFFCVQPAQQGGETPIVNCHKVYQLLNPKVRSRLAQKQLMYVRNYIEGLDVSWQDFFHTTDKTVVEQSCRQSRIDCQWSGNNLRTSQVRPAISHHPKTGKPLFFNQVQLHHISCLESNVRASLLSTLGAKNLPRNVYYGDGSPIEDSVMAEIGAAYQQAQVSFPWQQGDILMLDNMLIAHGRNPYQGSRKIVVAMGEMSSDKQ